LDSISSSKGFIPHGNRISEMKNDQYDHAVLLIAIAFSSILFKNETTKNKNKTKLALMTFDAFIHTCTFYYYFLKKKIRNQRGGG
jgi:hypothetical protein